MNTQKREPQDSDGRRTIRYARAPFLALIGVLMVGCGSDTVALTFGFPSVDVFVRSETVQIYGVPAASEQPCPALNTEVMLGAPRGATFDTAALDICAVRDGVILDDVPEGRVAYVAVARGPASTAFATGCVVRDIAAGSPEVVLVLTPSEDYRQAFPIGSGTAGCSAQQRCSGGCP
ncbi:MAG: hypothetical protein AAGF12_03370 [Myxococcota bacterium]